MRLVAAVIQFGRSHGFANVESGRLFFPKETGCFWAAYREAVSSVTMLYGAANRRLSTALALLSRASFQTDASLQLVFGIMLGSVGSIRRPVRHRRDKGHWEPNPPSSREDDEPDVGISGKARDRQMLK